MAAPSSHCDPIVEDLLALAHPLCQEITTDEAFVHGKHLSCLDSDPSSSLWTTADVELMSANLQRALCKWTLLATEVRLSFSGKKSEEWEGRLEGLLARLDRRVVQGCSDRLVCHI